MPQHIWLSLAAVWSLTTSTTGVWARSEPLWAERPAGSAPLAQVPDFAALAAKTVPAVVSLQVEQKVSVDSSPGGPGSDPFDYFHRFFGGEMPREFRNRGVGSGFLIRGDGLVLTNYHVVEGAESIAVTLTLDDGSEKSLEARVLGSAPEWDIALIQTKDKLAAPASFLGDSDSVQIGDWVMAVGNPFGLSHSVSVGIISAKDRRDIRPSGRPGIYNFLQTDASINPGNSGGPLINMRGEVIGINSAINAAGSGIGFAIPINMVKDMLPDLKEKGRYERSWIGVRIQPLSPELAESYGLKSAQGALVAAVVPAGPADKAGIREGDIVLEFEGKEVRSNTDLPLLASMAGIGRKVRLKIWRDGRELPITLTLAKFPDETAVASGEEVQSGGELGVTVTDVTPELQRRFEIGTTAGAFVKDVASDGPAARNGLRPGDVIASLNGKPVANARAFAEGVHILKRGAVLRLKVLRSGDHYFVAFRKP